MTRKQAQFVEEYAVDFNGTQAAIRAGYAPRSARVTASRLLTKAAVQDAVEALQRQSAERLQITRELVLEELRAAIELARERQDVHAMIRGWVEIAKLLGLYEPERRRVEVSTTSRRVVTQLEGLSDAELLAVIDAPG